MTTDVRITGLTKRYGDLTALDDVSIDIPAGTVLCVLGPSGCGKSTLLRIVAGLVDADAGTVDIDGMRIVDGPRSAPPERRSLNLVFQDYALWPHLRVTENIGYGLYRSSRQQRDRKVAELLDMFRIANLGNRFPSELSGGQQQRVAIARALATDPKLLLFDEPLSNLDVQLRSDMRLELSELLESVGTTAIYVTHDPIEACTLATQVLVLRDGKEEQRGSPEGLFRDPASAWVASLAGFDTRLPAIAGAVVDQREQIVNVGDQRLVARTDSTGARPAEGADVVVMLHPHSISVGDTPAVGLPRDHNVLTGMVRRVTYEGRNWRIRLDVGGGVTLAVSTPQPVEVGAQTTVRFAIDETLAFTSFAIDDIAGTGVPMGAELARAG